jgi:hypothetical protein
VFRRLRGFQRWHNQLVPDDGVTGQGDAGDESEEVPAATESSADEEPSGDNAASVL